MGTTTTHPNLAHQSEQYERSFEFEIIKNGNERKCQLIRSNHLEVARGARGLRDGGVGGVGGVEVTLDGALRRMLDLEEALGEAFHLQVQKVQQGVNTSLQKLASFYQRAELPLVNCP